MHHVIQTEGNRHRVAILWDSVTEPERIAETLKLEANKEHAKVTAKGDRFRDQGDRQNQSWLGASVDTLNQRLVEGWPEGVRKLEELSTREINPVSIRRRRTRGDQGDELDMQAVWRGDLSRAWTKTRRQSRAGGFRTVTLICNLSDSCGVSASELYWRGAAVLKLADALTAAGYGVGIYGSINVRGCSEDSTVSQCQFVEIKATDSPLDLSQLASLTAMPGWFRTRGFAGIIAACDLAGKKYCSSLGRPEHDNIDSYAEMLGLTNAFIQGKVNNKDSAEKWIDEVMAKVETPELEAA